MADTDREYRKAFYRALNVHQGARMLSEEEFERYYVPIYDQPAGPAGPDLVKEMTTAVDFTTGGSVQLLAGYRGAGKTTELLRLCRVLDRDAYVPVYWDVEDYFNTELPLEEGAFLVGLAAGFVDNCEGAGIPEGKLTERIRKLFNRIEVDSGGALDASAGPVSVSIKAALQDDTSFRNQVKKALLQPQALQRGDPRILRRDGRRHARGEDPRLHRRLPRSLPRTDRDLRRGPRLGRVAVLHLRR